MKEDKSKTETAEQSELTLPQVKLDFLIKKINDSFEFYLKRKDNNKLKAFRISMLVTILAAIISIMAGLSLTLEDEYQKYVSVAILVFGAASTVFSAWDGFYNHKDLWIKYTDFVIKLHSLRTEAEYFKLEGEHLNMAQVNRIYEEYFMILEEVGKSWVQIRSKPQEKEEKIDNEEA